MLRPPEHNPTTTVGIPQEHEEQPDSAETIHQYPHASRAAKPPSTGIVNQSCDEPALTEPSMVQREDVSDELRTKGITTLCRDGPSESFTPRRPSASGASCTRPPRGAGGPRSKYAFPREFLLSTFRITAVSSALTALLLVLLENTTLIAIPENRAYLEKSELRLVNWGHVQDQC